MTHTPKTRIDLALVVQGLCDSRARARAEIDAGHVWCDGAPVRKASQSVPSNATLEVRGQARPWVSRAGEKLAHAIAHFGITFQDSGVLDIGASTGGFTEVALHYGAHHVTAVDVGHGQLHETLQHDPRVTSMEGTNIKDVHAAMFARAPDRLVCDVSFISLAKALPTSLELAAPGAILLALIKPQFEVGKDRLGKGGVVKDAAVQQDAVQRVCDWLSRQPDWHVIGVTDSPIAGSDGNKEFLLAAKKTT